jgi:hypothetical protein
MELQGTDVIQELTRSFVEARGDCDALEMALEDKKKERDAIEEKLSQAMIFRGIRQQVLLDGSMIYLSSQMFLSRNPGYSTEDVCRGLREAGLGELVKERYYQQSVLAMCREMHADQTAGMDFEAKAHDSTWAKTLPDSLRGMLNVTQKMRVRIKGQGKEDPAREDLE